MKRRLISLLIVAAMLTGLPGALRVAGAADSDGTAAETPTIQLPAIEAEPEEPGKAEGESFPALEFDEWDPVKNTEHPGGLEPNPFWRSHVSPVELSMRPSLMDPLPAKYDLRTLGRSTTVKNQYRWGTCWTFGALAALESNILTKSGVGGIGPEADPDYSEHQLAWFAYQQQTADTLARSEVGQGQVEEGRATDPDPLNRGGNVSLTTSILASWQGAATERSIPYQNTTGGTEPTGNWSLLDSQRDESAVHLTDVDLLPSPASYSAYGNNSMPTATATYSYDKAAEEIIKRTIMEQGAVTIGYYADQSKPAGSKDGTYFNYTNNCQFVNVLNASTIPNHAVCIVGWDDTYPRTNFNSGIQPEEDGAWIVKNSWGDKYYDNGYFYLSYYDRTIRDVASLQGETKFSYDHNYQYDYLQLGSYLSGYHTSSETGVANVFTANGRETLKAVSIVTDTALSDVTVEVYRLKADASGPYDGTLASTCSKTLPWAGYHTLELDTPAYLSEGDRFSVVAVVKKPDGRYYLPLEAGCEAEGYIAVANPGESYQVYPASHKYKDVTEESGNIYGGGTYVMGNAMVKAFTVGTDPNFPTVTTQPTNQEAQVGTTVSFSVTAEGTELSYQWQVSTDDGVTWMDVTGATSGSYTTPALTYEMEGRRYRCRVSNSHGSICSDVAIIISVFPNDVTEIYSLAQLEAFRNNVNNGVNFAGKTIRLMADIDLSGKYGSGKLDWTPIGTSTNPFPQTATFDGGGHMISGVYVNEGSARGFFGYNRGTIKNLGVSGLFDGFPEQDNPTVGGVCGENSGSGVLQNCYNAGTVNGASSGSSFGGVCGNNRYGGSIQDCYNTGAITGTSSYGSVGGVCGENYNGTITNCYNTGKVTGILFYGGTGGVCGESTGGSIKNSYNIGDIFGEDGSAGGVCGENDSLLQDCYNAGEVTGTSSGSAGGVCGENINLLQDCYNTGTVTGTSSGSVGGVCGENGYNGSIQGCYNTGAVTSKESSRRVAGVCGENSYGGSIQDCYNTGDVIGSDSGSVAGVCGDFNSSGVKIQRCYNTGSLKGSYCYGICAAGRSAPKTIVHCYYLSTESQTADDIVGQIEAKTAEQFTSGEVAYLLQSAKEDAEADQVWGQSVKGILKNAAPVLTSDPEKTVYKVSFCIKGNGSDTVHAIKYANLTGVSGLPDAPVSGTTKLTRWSLTADVNGEEFTEDTPVSSGICVYAIGETMYGEDEAEKTVTLTYGEPTQDILVDLSRHVVMGDGSDPRGRFKFTIMDGGVDSVQIVGETLEIAADIPANEAGYPITIRAFKISSEPVLMTTSLGSESFLFTVTVVVHKAKGSGSVSLESWIYGETARTPVPVSKTNGVEDVTYLYKERDAGDETYSETVPTAPGEYTLLAKFAETDNYKEVESTANFKIAQAASVIDSAPQARELLYTGQAQELVTAGVGIGGELQYSLDGENYSAAIPTATEVGSYTVSYILIGDTDHLDNPGGTVTIQIGKAAPAYTVPEGLSATEGSSLAAVTLPKGWHWADETQKADKLGTHTFDAVYTPEDTDHYQTVTVSLSVTVKARTYKVTLATNGGTVNSGDVKSYTVGTSTPLPTDVIRTGYNFVGWYENSTLDGAPITAIPKEAAGDKTFFAKWEKIDNSGDSGGISHPKPKPTPAPTPQPPAEKSQPEEVRFEDVKETDWYYNFVQKVSAVGLMRGMSDTKFGPRRGLTRGMAVTVLYKLEKEPETAFVPTFEDCVQRMYYMTPVSWASEQEIVKGFSATRFCPDNNITREQMAVIVYRYAQYRGLDLSTSKALPYLDSEKISGYAQESVRWVTERGIMLGDTTKHFSPRNDMTRAEAAVVFQRLLEMLERETGNDATR